MWYVANTRQKNLKKKPKKTYKLNPYKLATLPKFVSYAFSLLKPLSGPVQNSFRDGPTNIVFAVRTASPSPRAATCAHVCQSIFKFFDRGGERSWIWSCDRLSHRKRFFSHLMSLGCLVLLDFPDRHTLGLKVERGPRPAGFSQSACSAPDPRAFPCQCDLQPLRVAQGLLQFFFVLVPVAESTQARFQFAAPDMLANQLLMQEGWLSHGFVVVGLTTEIIIRSQHSYDMVQLCHWVYVN